MALATGTENFLVIHEWDLVKTQWRMTGFATVTGRHMGGCFAQDLLTARIINRITI